MTEPAKQATGKMFPVRLLRNYQPDHEYEVLGYYKPERKVKDAAGGWIVVDKGGWQAGEMKPAPFPGVGYSNKIWAETYVKVPVEDAKKLIENKSAERADALPD